MKSVYRFAPVVATLTFSGIASAVEIEAYLSGNFGAAGYYGNSPGFQNHYVGTTHTAATPIPERRNFFLFDVGGVSEPIVSARLKVYVPLLGPDGGDGYLSEDPTEEYLVTSTPVPAETIAFPSHTPTEAMAIYSTFGMGLPFAIIGASPDSKGTDLTLEFSGFGITALNMARLGSGKFAATGRLTTLGDPIPPLKTQLLFSHTDPTGVFVPPTPYPRLEFETVPEPSSLLALSLFGLLASRRRAKVRRR